MSETTDTAEPMTRAEKRAAYRDSFRRKNARRRAYRRSVGPAAAADGRAKRRASVPVRRGGKMQPGVPGAFGVIGDDVTFNRLAAGTTATLRVLPPEGSGKARGKGRRPAKASA